MRHLKKGHQHGLHSGLRTVSAAAECVHACARHAGSDERTHNEVKGEADGQTAGDPARHLLPGNLPCVL